MYLSQSYQRVLQDQCSSKTNENTQETKYKSLVPITALLVGRPQNTKTLVVDAVGSAVHAAVVNTRVPRVLEPAATTADTPGA